MKDSIKKIMLGLIIVLLCGGLLFLVSGITKQQESKRVTFDFLEFIESSQSDQSDTENKDAELPKHNKHMIQGIGGLAIPKIGLSLNIYEGVSEENITYGAGTDVEGRDMGKGNFVLASHDRPETFGRLHELEQGDMIYTINHTTLYSYKIAETYIAQDSDVRDIKRVRGDVESTPILTLYTCLGAEGTPNRTVVQATLTKQETIENSPSTIGDYFD